MDIVSELAAVERRIEAIASGPVESGAEFGATLGEALAERRDGSMRIVNASSHSQIDRLITLEGRASDVDPALIEAIVAIESGFDPNATSNAGARGLMQLMPQTAASLGVRDSYDPSQNIRGGTRYLRALLDRFGDVELAVAAYNAGPAAVERYRGVPPYAETRNYVRNVLTGYRELKPRVGVLNSAIYR
jgi:soluble lytic murein transglycosylase-like protein